MSAIPIHPEKIGRLTDAEATAFSLPFEHDWRYVRGNNPLQGSEEIIIDQSDSQFGLPDSYGQFVPAIRIMTDHELSVHGLHTVANTRLTIRQQLVRQNTSQQDASFLGRAHYDGEIGEDSRFYTISDTTPTNYYPSLNAKGHTREEILVPEGEPAVSFDPYDVVVASGLTYHQSPPVPREVVRTFMRLTYIYK
jgi:hypothetical protein